MRKIDFTTCNVCEDAGTFTTAKEVQRVYCNVRRFSDRQFTVWRCSSCQSLHSKEAVDLREYYQNYLSNIKPGYFLRCVYKNRLRLLSSHGFCKNSTLLDYGCNQGLFLAFLRQRGYANVFGYDPFVSPYMDQTVFQQQYDFIVSCQVIEHLAQPRYFFDQTVPYLRQKGILLIETPNAAEIPLCDTNGYLPHRNQTLHQPYHQHILSKGALLNLGRAQGLTLVQASRRIEYDTGFPGVNTRAFTTYIRLAGDMLDVVEEPIKLKLLLTSPQLLFYSLLGYFFPPQGLMSVVFRLRSWNCLSKNKN